MIPPDHIMYPHFTLKIFICSSNFLEVLNKIFRKEVLNVTIIMSLANMFDHSPLCRNYVYCITMRISPIKSELYLGLSNKQCTICYCILTLTPLYLAHIVPKAARLPNSAAPDNTYSAKRLGELLCPSASETRAKFWSASGSTLPQYTPANPFGQL